LFSTSGYYEFFMYLFAILDIMKFFLCTLIQLVTGLVNFNILNIQKNFRKMRKCMFLNFFLLKDASFQIIKFTTILKRLPGCSVQINLSTTINHALDRWWNADLLNYQFFVKSCDNHCDPFFSIFANFFFVLVLFIETLYFMYNINWFVSVFLLIHNLHLLFFITFVILY